MKTKKGIRQKPVMAKNELESYFDTLSAVSNLHDESIYVVDFKRRRFRFVSDNGIFLSGLASEEVMQMGYDFYKKLIHPDDYPLAVKMHQAIVRYFSQPDIDLRHLAYLTFNFRINTFRGLMTKHRLIPLILNDQELTAICAVAPTMAKTPGNLTAYYTNQDVCYQYSLLGERWKKEPLVTLNEREKSALELYKAGIPRKDVADKLCISLNTLRNLEAAIYNKFDVHSMLQAINYPSVHGLILVEKKAKNKKPAEPKKSTIY